MYRLSRLRFIFPIGLLLFFFLDGSLSSVLSGVYFNYPYSMVSHLVILWIVLGIVAEGRNQVIPFVFFAAAIGLMFDMYYSGILGLFVFVYPMIVGLTRLLVKNFSPTFLSAIMIFFLDIAFLEIINYIAYTVIGMANANLSDFVLYTLAPTLALNLIYFVILYVPIMWIYQRYSRSRS